MMTTNDLRNLTVATLTELVEQRSSLMKQVAVVNAHIGRTRDLVKAMDRRERTKSTTEKEPTE